MLTTLAKGGAIMDKGKRIIELLEQNNENETFTFYEKFDAIKRGSYFVLNYLYKHNEEVISSDLSNALHVSTARMTKLLQKMEKKQLITKNKSSTDFRKTVVCITEKGIEMIESFKELVINYIKSIVEEIGFDEYEQFLKTSLKMQNVVKKYKLLEAFNQIE